MLLFSIYAINFYFAFVTSATVFSSSQKNCQFQCEERNLAFPLNRGELRWPTPLDQNYSTYVQSCKHGCEDVDERESKCEEKCSEDGIIKLACVQGCRAVLVSFLAHAQELLTQVNANMEIMENFMKLKWKFPDSITSEVKELATADLFWFVQTKPSNSDVGWKWTPLTKGTFNDSIISNEVNIPFDQYEDIEVRLALSFRNQVLVSRKITYHLPLNKSGTKLEIIGQLQLSDDRVAVCYKTNLPVPKYKMTVSTLDDNILNTEESISRCHLFANLPKENCCKVAISAIDENGSITASKEILLDFFVNQIETELLEKSTPKLIFSNGTHLIESDSVDQYSLTENSKIISFPLTTDDSITAISSISDRIIAIGSKKGYLWTFRMFSNETDDTDQQQSTVIQLKTVEESDTPIIQIEIDPIQNFLYAVQHDKGVLRCKLRTLDIEEPSDCILIVFQNPLNPPKQIAIDPINGFIYSLHVDNIIQKSEMIPFNASGIETIQFSQILNDLSPSKGIFYDIRKFLFYSIFQNGSMISLNPISDQIHMITELRFSEVSKFQIKNDEIIWSEQKCDEENSENKICIFSDHFQRNDEEVPKKFTFTSSIFSFTFMDDIFLKPRIKSIESISLLVTDKSARITWTSYSNLPFQAQSKNWRNTTYYLKVTSSESSENQPFEEYTTNTDLTINIVPSITYNAQIQVCSEDFCSTPVSTSNKAIKPFFFDIPFVFTRKKEDDIETLDALGNVIEIDDSVKNLEKIAHPHVLDNTTKTVYLAGDHSMGIFKKQLDDTTGNIKPFKDGLFVEMLSIMPSRSIIFIATSYKIVSYRLPTTFDYEFYSCEESLEDCAEVIGISTDDETGILYFITQSQNGSFTFWEANQNDRNPKQVSTIDRLIPFRRFHVVQDKLILVTKHGNIVQLDRNLSSINIAKNLDQVNQIVPLQYANLLHKIEFTDEIKFKEGSKTTLEWAISPSMEIGTILYKVSIFRENMGNSDAPITTIQLESNYTIPSDVLENWSSAQRFDISIQAITPWQSIILNRTGLFAPVKPPTPPTQLRIFATQQKTVDGPRALISLFWSQPIEWNGTPYQYIVNCTKDDGNIIGGPISASQTHFSFAVKSGKVSCQAAASNEPTNIGKYSEVITIDSSEIRPLVKLFAIDSTNSLISLDDLSHGETKRREIRQVAQPTKVDYQALAFIGEDLYAVRKEGDSAQPVLIQIDTNHIENTVHKVSIGGDVTRIDTMTSDWVGHRLLFVSGSSLYQLPLEPFLSTSLLNPQKLIQLSTATDAKQLAYDPFKNTAYLLTKNGSLFALDLNSKTETNLALKITCLASQTVTWMMTEFTWNRASSPKIYALTWNGLIYVDLTEDYQCNEVRIDWGKFGDRGLKSISSFAIADKLFAFVTSSEMLIYGRETITPIPITNPPLKQILAVSQSSQPYPDRSCFELPSSKEIIFTIVNEGKTGGFLEVTRSISPSICPEVSMPQTQYEIYFTRKNTDKVKHVKSFSDRIHVENGILDKETDYDVTVAWLNRYSPANGVSLAKSFRTGFGYPSAPRDPHAIPVTPDTVFLYWSLPETLNAPISEIKYKISQQAAGLLSPTSIAVIPLSEVVSSNVSSDSAACLINPCRVKIANLRPSNDYKFWVTATHISHLDSTFLKDDDAISSETSARTFDIPGTLRPDNVTGSSLLLRWTGLEPEKKPASISIQYKESGDFHEWQSPSNSSFDSDISTELIMINNLLSATSYDYRFVATYTGTYTIDGKVLAYKEEYYQLIQQARTKAGVPTLPQNVESQIDQDGWILTWKEPMSDGGSPITSYAVETRINKTSEWEIAERGLDGWKQWWRPGKTEIPQTDLEFRIRAANIEGFGPYAYTEERKPIIEEENGNILLYFLILSIALLIFSLIIVLIFWLKSRKVQRLKKREADDERNCISLDVVTNLTFSPMKQLPTEINNELKNLPHVNKEDVRIGSLIDIGTYGKVFEGIAEEIPSSWEKNIKVAVKTLKDDFSYHDKILFMKEAILLNNLDHANIVKMLGVCFVPRSEFLLVEFMEGGNLLDFLRDSIPTENQSSELCLRDLLSIAVDIARGMNYLERLPHVHRGLCAKKCLLSTKESKQRITKLNIGTSKEFESLSNRNDLEASEKVRWMAPEILKSLFFTSKSDVWAFGVLLYEIFSLGEMPYGDKDEHKIVGEVRNGFILSKPSYCPDRLYKLMQQCWAFDLAKRPNFATILKIFETFRERSEFQDDKPLQAQDGHYNVNFDASHDSTSSERGDLREPHSPSHLNKSFGGFENNGFEPSLGNFVGIRKSSKSSTARSLRREKAKSRTNNMDDGDHKNQRPLSYLSVDTISTEYGGERGSLHSPSSSNLNPYLQQMYDTPKSRMSAAPAIGIINDGYESSSNPSLNHSRSLAALPDDTNQGNGLAFQAASTGHLRSQNLSNPRNRPQNGQIPSYEQTRNRNLVSQV